MAADLADVLPVCSALISYCDQWLCCSGFRKSLGDNFIPNELLKRMCPRPRPCETHEIGSILGEAVFALLEVVSASVFGQLIEGGTTELPELVDGAFRSVLRSLLEYFVWSDTGNIAMEEISHHQDVPGLNSSARYPLRLTRHCRFMGRMPCCWNVVA